MTRHDIKLRRKEMTSGRIGRHKNFSNLIKRHKSSRIRAVIQTIAYIIILIILLTLIYYLGLR